MASAVLACDNWPTERMAPSPRAPCGRLLHYSAEYRSKLLSDSSPDVL